MYNGGNLTTYLPESDQLNIASLSRLFDNKSECYKLFWFQAILSFVCIGQQEISYEEIIDEMIADAWYMVTEYHLNLGPNDTLEKVVNYISNTTSILPNVKKQEIIKWLSECDDLVVLQLKRVLALNVPYRLQAPFLNANGEFWKCGTKELAQKINRQSHLIYYFIDGVGLNTRIKIESEWMEYLSKNREILRGWIQYNMIIYLQKRNPSVPGISDKLVPPVERKLEKVKKLWKALAEIHPIREIYGDNIITASNISIDHFVPWSYVAHDELWNLHPTTKAINSSKSNNLPEWNLYFPKLAEQEYSAYRQIWQNDKVHDLFDKCQNEHLNNQEIRFRLYKQGLDSVSFEGQLEEVLYPVYQAAKTSGFKEWSLTVQN